MSEYAELFRAIYPGAGWHACPGCGTLVDMDLNPLPAGRG